MNRSTIANAVSTIPIILRHYVGFRIPTHLTVRERAALYSLAKSAPSKIMVEIGSYLGASSYFLAAGVSRTYRDASLICVDTWKNDAMTEGERDTYAEFLKNTNRFSDVIVPMRGLSQEVAAQVRQTVGNGIGLLFIDGDHSYDAVKADWESYMPYLCRGAIVVFHDVGWAEGVQRLVSDQVAPNVISDGALPNLWWGRMRS